MNSFAEKGAALAACALLVFGLSGCGGSSSSASKDTLRVGVTNFADSLEPTANYFGWQVMRYGVGEALVHFDDKMRPEPWIAESWAGRSGPDVLDIQDQEYQILQRQSCHR